VVKRITFVVFAIGVLWFVVGGFGEDLGWWEFGVDSQFSCVLVILIALWFRGSSS
jgi:hypothetical protein